MNKIVASNQELCAGCNRCTRECPIEMANLTSQNAQGELKVQVDITQCIACGACVSVCKHKARYFMDDFDILLADLARGEAIDMMVAPSVRTNFPQWKRLFTFLKQKGVAHIYDVSMGADICIWAHVRYLEKEKPASIITQPCPAIVSYCKKHRPELLAYLSPIHSPMCCTALYLRQYVGRHNRIAALSPCIAKKDEFEATGLAEYSVTFAKLADYIKDNNIALPPEETDFDLAGEGLGVLFPTPGGLKENIHYFTDGRYRIDCAEGQGIYRLLDEYAQAPQGLLPDIYDVLNCMHGCNNGPGCVKDKNIFGVQAAMNAAQRNVEQCCDRTYFEKLYESYDKRFRLQDFMCSYAPADIPVVHVSEEEIQEAFRKLDKNTYAKQNIDCCACGSLSCRDMARKIALKITIPLNCIVKSRDDMRAEHKKNEELYRHNAEHIALVHKIGSALLTAQAVNHEEVMRNSLHALCDTLGGSNAHIWKQEESESGKAGFRKLYSWVRGKEVPFSFLGAEYFPGWMERLEQGRPINCNREAMSDDEKILFPSEELRAFLIIPLIIGGKLWGVLAMHSLQERLFDQEEIAVLTAGGLLLAYFVLEIETTEKLIRAREQALSGTKAKSDFLSRMSHEMRTPMNAIIGMTKIADHTQDIQKLRYCLSTIEASSTHLLGLINDILDMAKIEAGKFDLDSVQFNLQETLTKVCNIIMEKVESKKQKFRVCMDEKMPPDFIGDALRLSQVVTNLLSNAVKFTPDRGEIHMRVRELERENMKSILRFSVKDTGIGMTPEQVQSLFHAFTQADAGITSRFGGTGLGLAISKTIVEKMNGKIWVESVMGEGSEFLFDVELQNAEKKEQEICNAQNGGECKAAKAHEDTARSSKADLSQMHILLTEDIAINREIFIALFAKTGIQIDTAENGQEALEKFIANPQRYDVIVMDIQMPVMDGYEATRAIRGLGTQRAKEIPIIAMTANAFREDIEACLACGMNDHLSKPIDEKLVMQKLTAFRKIEA